jgi:hypothetical protein
MAEVHLPKMLVDFVLLPPFLSIIRVDDVRQGALSGRESGQREVDPSGSQIDLAHRTTQARRAHRATLYQLISEWHYIARQAVSLASDNKEPGTALGNEMLGIDNKRIECVSQRSERLCSISKIVAGMGAQKAQDILD